MKEFLEKVLLEGNFGYDEHCSIVSFRYESDCCVVEVKGWLEFNEGVRVPTWEALGHVLNYVNENKKP